MGELHVIFGPMFSGKTGKLLHHLSVRSMLGWSVLYVNSSYDTRGEQFSTHNELLKTTGTSLDMVKADALEDIDVSRYQVIGVDEAQFFPDLLEKVSEWVDDAGKIVYAAGLNGNFRREKFGQILDLVPLADTVDKLSAYCIKCSKNKVQAIPAIFSKKRSADTNEIDAGAADKYEAVCRQCYLRSQTPL